MTAMQISNGNGAENGNATPNGNRDVLFGGISFQRDEHGIPLMPEALHPYAAMVLTDDDVDKILDLAAGVYELWKNNDYRQVSLPSYKDVACYEEGADDFHAELPEWPEGLLFDPDTDLPGSVPADHPEYPAWLERWNSYVDYLQKWNLALIRIANAKRYCQECPVKRECLASTLTLRKRSDMVNYDRHGVWGGWGAAARAKVFWAMVDIWRADGVQQAELERTQAEQEELAAAASCEAANADIAELLDTPGSLEALLSYGTTDQA